MSCSYADGLSPYENKGKLGLKEIFDSDEEVEEKVKKLAEMIENSKHVVIHTGAGISTSAGIPDFRGPNGVWTLEEKGEKPTINVSFDNALPTKTHLAILKLVEAGKVQFVVSQNIDGLHLKSGLERKYLSELHGNMFIEECSNCKKQFVLKSATTSVGKKNLNRPCLSTKVNSRRCRGKTCDTILDWEHSLPEKDLEMADYHSNVSDLSICLGTTLQIVPSGNLPLNSKKNNGKLVICNLQPTKHDKKADLVIHTYVDRIMEKLMEIFELKIPDYDAEKDPTKSEKITEWTMPAEVVEEMKKVYKLKCQDSKRKIDRSDSTSKKRKRQDYEIKEEKTDVEIKIEEKFNVDEIKEEKELSIKMEEKKECDETQVKNEVIDENILRNKNLIGTQS